MTVTAINNPANAVTPNVIPAAAPAPMASRELCEEDFSLPFFKFSCAGSLPIIAGPSTLVSATNSATELNAKEIRGIVC